MPAVRPVAPAPAMVPVVPPVVPGRWYSVSGRDVNHTRRNHIFRLDHHRATLHRAATVSGAHTDRGHHAATERGRSYGCECDCSKFH